MPKTSGQAKPVFFVTVRKGGKKVGRLGPYDMRRSAAVDAKSVVYMAGGTWDGIEEHWGKAHPGKKKRIVLDKKGKKVIDHYTTYMDKEGKERKRPIYKTHMVKRYPIVTGYSATVGGVKVSALIEVKQKPIGVVLNPRRAPKIEAWGRFVRKAAKNLGYPNLSTSDVKILAQYADHIAQVGESRARRDFASRVQYMRIPASAAHAIADAAMVMTWTTPRSSPIYKGRKARRMRVNRRWNP